MCKVLNLYTLFDLEDKNVKITHTDGKLSEMFYWTLHFTFDLTKHLVNFDSILNYWAFFRVLLATQRLPVSRLSLCQLPKD